MKWFKKKKDSPFVTRSYSMFLRWIFKSNSQINMMSYCQLLSAFVSPWYQCNFFKMILTDIAKNMFAKKVLKQNHFNGYSENCIYILYPFLVNISILHPLFIHPHLHKKTTKLQVFWCFQSAYLWQVYVKTEKFHIICRFINSLNAKVTITQKVAMTHPHHTLLCKSIHWFLHNNSSGI